MALEVEKDSFHGWCSWWPEGLAQEPYRRLFGDVCRIHDIMGYMSELGSNAHVKCYGITYSWASLGYESPLPQEEQDAWLLRQIIAIADNHPDLSPEQREEVRKNGCLMYLGLRSLGQVYRFIT